MFKGCFYANRFLTEKFSEKQNSYLKKKDTHCGFSLCVRDASAMNLWVTFPSSLFSFSFFHHATIAIRLFFTAKSIKNVFAISTV